MSGGLMRTPALVRWAVVVVVVVVVVRKAVGRVKLTLFEPLHAWLKRADRGNMPAPRAVSKLHFAKTREVSVRSAYRNITCGVYT
ncbi:hypothetical protein Micbo1qcDRAFT_163099 [Microdochium bolleyi]|uniref:Uncharacterized protein n=1 Tax=Microdochium bolleyi TaxID=196109 RepID=A0A136J2C7_9PEZI|nr:hypothetical protein Micbo1qcDRAFT_163099 [Microdochium bolleyi]